MPVGTHVVNSLGQDLACRHLESVADWWIVRPVLPQGVRVHADAGEDKAGISSAQKQCVPVLLCRVCACMQTQAKVQLDDRDGRSGVPAPHPLQAPGQQQMGPPPSQYAGGPPPGQVCAAEPNLAFLASVGDAGMQSDLPEASHQIPPPCGTPAPACRVCCRPVSSYCYPDVCMLA